MFTFTLMQYLPKNKHKAIPGQSWDGKTCRVTTGPTPGTKMAYLCRLQRQSEKQMPEKGEVFLCHRTQTAGPKELDAEQSKTMFIYSWSPFKSEKKKDNLENISQSLKTL